MKKLLHVAILTSLGAISLSACDPAPAPAPGPAPNATASTPVDREASAEGETPTDLARDKLIEVLRDESAFSRAQQLGAMLPTLEGKFAPAVAKIIENPPIDLGATELDLLVRYWATHQPEDAALWAKEKSPTIYRDASVLAAVTAWAEVDPQAAVTALWPWAMTTELQTIVPSGLVRGWFTAGDPPELTEWISSLPVGFPRQRAIAAYIRIAIQTRGAEAVKRWAESISDDDATYKLAVFRRTTSALSNLDVEAGVRWCETQCDGPYGDNMRSIIARSWVIRDGPAALAWLSQANEGHERDLSVRVSFAQWARVDREAALDWMASQTTGGIEPWLQPILPVYARLLSTDSPSEAIEWAGRIESKAERELVLIQVARVWRYLDEAAAEDWLRESSLSAEAREQVREPVDEERPTPSG